MAMQVAVQDDTVLTVELHDMSLEMVNLWKQLFSRVLPLTVEVHAGQARPVIPADYAVNVDHGHQIENEITSQEVGLRLVIICKKVNESFHNKRTVTFPRMNACSDDYSFACCHFFSCAKGGYLQEVLLVTCQGFAQFGPGNILAPQGVIHQQVKVSFQVGVAVWIAIGEKNCLVGLKVIRKFQRVVESRVTYLISEKVVLKIADVYAITVPCAVMVLVTLGQDTHTVVEQAAALCVVDDIEGNCAWIFCNAPEKKPLVVTLRVDIILQR